MIDWTFPFKGRNNRDKIILRAMGGHPYEENFEYIADPDDGDFGDGVYEV